MKISKLILLSFVMLCFAFNINAQASFDASETITLDQMEKQVKKDNGYVFDDFVKANVHQISGKEFSNGVIKDQYINFNENTNTVYLKQGDQVLVLNTSAIKGVYTHTNGNFMKCNEDFPNNICEVIHMTERIFIYKMNNKYFAKSGNINKEITLTTNAIESAFDLESGMVDKYIAANNLDITNSDHLKRILNQYETIGK